MRNRLLFKTNLFLVGLLTIMTSCSDVTENVQWRGPDRSGIYPDTGLKNEWPDKGPRLVLKLKGFGKGYSSPLVYKDKIYLTGRIDSLEYISCYGLDGNLIWQEPYGKAWYKSFPDTRCTPTIKNSRIYLVSGSGEVACHSAKTGKQIWFVDADSLYYGNIWQYGVSESPLLTEDAVIYTPGGDSCSLIALDQKTGELIWKAKSLGGARGYASHILIKHNDIPLIIAQTARDVLGINARSGELLWHHSLIEFHLNEMGKGNNINTPIYQDGRFFISSGYDHPGILFEINSDGNSVRILWENTDIDIHLGGAILWDGYLYASNWQNNSKGRWVCVEWETGTLMWETEWYNKGSIISADGLMNIYEEKSGHVGLLRPNPVKFDLISEFQAREGSGPHWAHPSIYQGNLYLRHGDVIMVYDLKDNSNN